VRSHSQLSPYLEACCLRVSANVSYHHAAEDIECFTGVQVPSSVQQRLVHRQDFALHDRSRVDGGNIRVRTRKENPVHGKGTKRCACMS
jgi:hypothetical protein